MADPEIPAAAVQAAAEVLWRNRNVEIEIFPLAEAREVLAAALPHLPSVGVTCPWCLRVVNLRTDGTLDDHRVWDVQQCPGAHKIPQIRRGGHD